MPFEGMLLRHETTRGGEVPGRGFEPLRIAPPDPKSGASANFATLAKTSAIDLTQNPSTDGAFPTGVELGKRLARQTYTLPDPARTGA